MTSYNERLVQQLFRALTKGGLEKEKEIESKGRYIHRPMKSIVHEEAQALTSLIKELVAEAKPGKYSSGESILNVDGIGEVDGYEGYNQAIDQFEQNLLKALEEVE